MKKIGLFGGTFDPVHIGHIELARYSMKLCDLSEIIFIPSGVPPHKPDIRVTSFEHRVAMLKLAIGAEKKFFISTIEKHFGQPSFTIDTLDHFIKKNDDQYDYYFLIGIDAFAEIHTWKDSESVLDNIDFIVSARQGYDPEFFESFINNLQFSKKKDNFWYNNRNGRSIFYLNIEIPGISSSDVRKSIQQKTVSDDMIDPAVFNYIDKHHLYNSD